ncbi:hypothetical protein [Bifidobacterium lemurum]|uniref:hypothetical protein n=1 Tax=Bifidobacterium lemurum TaxID=1603886 RepID=UPI0011608C8F|nr:hypothetical protein [Bifidobacterium lemurum]QOL34197.1 hypothetical protein BL8807_10825 [Bifidobacterium lemurum]
MKLFRKKADTEDESAGVETNQAAQGSAGGNAVNYCVDCGSELESTCTNKRCRDCAAKRHEKHAELAVVAAGAVSAAIAIGKKAAPVAIKVVKNLAKK